MRCWRCVLELGYEFWGCGCGGLIIGGVMIAISQRRGEPSEKLAYVAWPIIGGIIALFATSIDKVFSNW